MKSFKEYLATKIDYNFEIFEASDALKREAAKIIKDDKEAEKLKKAAVKNSDMVNDYLDYVYMKYEKEINTLSKKYKADFDEIAQVFIAL